MVTQNHEPMLDIQDLAKIQTEWPEELLPEIRNQLKQSGMKLVVLDDDPTGTQTVRDIPVLTQWKNQDLEEMLLSDYPAFFILTNSRSLPEPEAWALGHQIGLRLDYVSRKIGVRVVVVSRSDSTLRGHFPAEVDAVASAMAKEDLPYILIPFFLEGGRFTINDIHYVQEGNSLIPAALTPFAKDAAFGFNSSNLKHYVEEKTLGTIQASKVTSISLEDIRCGGPKRVEAILMDVANASACIVNAVSYRDMEVVVTALMAAEKKGREFLYRTAASFVKTRVGLMPDGKLLAKDELVTDSSYGGLFIIGSYVEKTSAQVKVLLETTDIVPVTVQVEKLLQSETRQEEVSRAIAETTSILKDGIDVAVYTSRELVTGQNAASSLEIGRVVSDSLIEIVKGISIQPRYLVAKGGITSSDVATKGLGVKKAMVLGQALPGVPVWKVGAESRYPGMSYIIFPGNVGDDAALATVQKNLSQ